MKLIIIVSALLGLSAAIPAGRNLKSPRIIGGSPAFEGQFPFAAAIRVTTLSGRYFCGGVLLNSQWILTAGQCVDGATLFSIQLGSTHLESDDPSTVVVQAVSSVLHPEYDGTQFLNDLGAIKLNEPVIFSDYIKPIGFLPQADLPGNVPVRALGWGQVNDEEGGPVNDLNWVMLTAISNEECSIFYQDQIKDGMICVVGQNNEGTCFGDIGSPLVQLVSFGHYVLYGIASFLSGNGCESTDPSGFTRTFPYKDWIVNTTES